jgi:DNA-directed RNA polymerase specialized sigma24 family protein
MPDSSPLPSGPLRDESLAPDPLRQVLGREDGAAWLYDTFSGRLFRRLGQRYRHLTEADREDVVQETFVAVLRQERRLLRSLLDRIAAPLTETDLERFLWDQACGVASNRRKSSWRRLVPFVEGVDLPGEGRGEQEQIDRDLLRQLDSCIQSGDVRAYLYYKLRYREGLAPEEIARMAGWTRRTTYRMRQTLEEVVKRCAGKLGIRGG